MSTQLSNGSPVSEFAGSRPRRGRVLRGLGAMLVVLVVWWFVGTGLIRSFRRIDWASLRVEWGWLVLSLLALLLARLMNGMSCTLLLRSLGERARFSEVVPAIWIASLGRYVPGKMAAVAGAAYLLVRLGMRLPAVLAALFLSTFLMILVGLVAASPLLLTGPMRQRMPFGWVVALVLLLGGIACLHPRAVTGMGNRVLAWLRRPALPDRLLGRHLAGAIGLTVLRNGLLGAGLWAAACALPRLSPADYAMSLGSAALASVAGFLAVFVPAGIGVHEGIYLVTFSPALGPQAGLLAVIFRFLHLLADALAGGAGMLRMRCVLLAADAASGLSTKETT